MGLYVLQRDHVDAALVLTVRLDAAGSKRACAPVTWPREHVEATWVLPVQHHLAASWRHRQRVHPREGRVVRHVVPQLHRKYLLQPETETCAATMLQRIAWIQTERCAREGMTLELIENCGE